MAETVNLSPAFAIQGISLSTYSQAGYTGSTITNYEDDAQTSGANYVELSSAAYIDLNSNIVSDAYSGSFDQTARMSDIDAAAQAAEAKGLSVMLKPQLVTNDPEFSQYTSGSWINLVNPNLVISNPDAFFAAYKTYIMKWAVLAQKDDVAILSIGNEMVAATKPQYTAYWDDIISSIRSVYSGKLTYSALLPVMTNSNSNEVAQIGFWDKLDFAGFDVYPSLATSADPTVATLNAGWTSQTVYGNPQNYQQFVADMAAKAGKPVIFTETGLPSFAGASDRQTTSDGNIGSNNDTNTVAVSDYTEQADWWQSFFDAWAVNKPSWLSGVFVWNNDPEDLGASAANSYNLIGKPAASVVSAWYGGKLAIMPGSDVLAGSQANDHLYAFGIDPATAGATSLRASLDTTVSVAVTASLLNGLAPAIDIVVNGKDYGTFQIQPIDSGYVNAQGVHFVTTQTFTVTLPSLQSIQSLQIVNDGPVAAAGSDFTTFFQGVVINGTALTNLSYTAANGYSQQQQLPDATQGGSSSQWDQGISTFDASPWNRALANS
ncbi:MAG: glycoside hydrolase family 113, partial [Janthinobacterium lividum]